ncbi:hypothetical protein ACFL49_01695 [Candidatus Omnitrophota bacterium]
MKIKFFLLSLLTAFACTTSAHAQTIDPSQLMAPLNETISVDAPAEETPQKEETVTPSILSSTIFDDKKLLDGYAEKYKELPKEILLKMIKDDTLSGYKSAAAVKVFNDRFGAEVVSREKKIVEKILLRRLNRTDSPFVHVEIMHTLCCMDRYKYFKSMVPALIQKLNHYNSTVNELAFSNINSIIEKGTNRSREARIVFNVLRKMMFLSRKRLGTVTEPDTQLKQRLELIRWSIKVLGTEELRKLPKETLPLL